MRAGTSLAPQPAMRTVLALLLVSAACGSGRPAHKPTLGPMIGQSTARGPSDPTAPLARDPEVTEGGGRLSGPVGNAPGSVTPTVGEQPSTIDQSRSADSSQQPATVYVPSIPAPTTGTAPANTIGGRTAPNTPNTPNTPRTPVTGPVTGAGPNGPGTGTGPATPTGPATGAPPPSNPGPAAGTGPTGSTPGTR